MAFFNLFKKPSKIQNRYFGELLPSKHKNKIDFFEGQGYFNDENKKVGFTINADADEPTEEQHQFYKIVQENFPVIAQRITPMIVVEFSNWMENFAITDFNKEFSVDSITIPSQIKKPIEWDIYFTTVHDKNHWVVVNFIGLEPVSVMVDG